MTMRSTRGLTALLLVAAFLVALPANGLAAGVEDAEVPSEPTILGSDLHVDHAWTVVPEGTPTTVTVWILDPTPNVNGGWSVSVKYGRPGDDVHHPLGTGAHWTYEGWCGHDGCRPCGLPGGLFTCYIPFDRCWPSLYPYTQTGDWREAACRITIETAFLHDTGGEQRVVWGEARASRYGGRDEPHRIPNMPGITVTNVAPTAALSVTGAPTAGEAVEVAIDGTDPGWDDRTWDVDWGDGSASAGSLAAGVPSTLATHTWASPGTYDVVLTVDDGDGGMTRTTTVIEVVGDGGGGGSTDGGTTDGTATGGGTDGSTTGDTTTTDGTTSDGEATDGSTTDGSTDGGKGKKGKGGGKGGGGGGKKGGVLACDGPCAVNVARWVASLRRSLPWL